MAYGRLDLQDFVDTITAANLSHIEDGIIDNETKVKTIESTLSEVKIATENLQESEIINSLFPLWHTLLSNGGEKITPATFSFDGNIIGKTFLPLIPEGGEVSVGYVRIGEAIAPMIGAMTCGGFYHVLLELLMMNEGYVEQEYGLNNINRESGAEFLMSSIVQGEKSYDYGDSPVTIYNNMMTSQLLSLMFKNMDFSFPSLSLPMAFSIDRSFEYNGIIYPSGFYSFYNQINIAKSMYSDNLPTLGLCLTDLPFVYVDKFWPLFDNEYPANCFSSQFNMSLDYSKESNAFDCFEESIFWNGIDKLKTDAIIPLDHPLSTVKCISYNPQAFLYACALASKITFNGNNVSITPNVFTHSNGFTDIAYGLGDKILIINVTLREDGVDLTPGVYAFTDEPFEIQFHGVNIQKLFNKHQINNQYLPEAPEFNLAEMGMSNVPLSGNEVTLEMNTTKLKFCSRKGPVRITIPTEVGEISCLATFNSIGSAHQSVITGYYNAIKFDTVITFTNDRVMVAIIPISQLT